LNRCPALQRLQAGHPSPDFDSRTACIFGGVFGTSASAPPAEPCPCLVLVHAASTCRATARTGSGKRRKPCTTHEIQNTASVDESRRGSKTGTNRWPRGRHRPVQMQQPRRQWCGHGRSSRACRSSRPEKKGSEEGRRRRRMRGRGQRERRGRGTARGEARLRGWATTAPRRNA